MTMTQAICNASPIIALSSIGHFELLTQLFSEIFVPDAVYQEICSDTAPPNRGPDQLTTAIEQGMVCRFSVSDHGLVTKLVGRLHVGEVEVVIGAVERGVSMVILDDRQARGLAATYQLEYTGTIGILLLAKSRGLMAQVKPSLDALADEGFRLSESIYAGVLKMAGEV